MEKKLEYVRVLAEKQVDGLVLVGSAFSSPVIEKSLQNYLPNTPIAAINSWLSFPNVHTLSIDHEAGAEMIMAHLIDQGYENIYFICCAQNQNTEKKQAAICDSLQNHGLPMNEQKNVFTVACNHEAVQSFAKEFLPLTRRRTAVIFSNDISAGYGLTVFREMGLSIPEEVAIVGYDNLCYPLLHFPEVTALDTKIEVLASLAANILHDIFKVTPHKRDAGSKRIW